MRVIMFLMILLIPFVASAQYKGGNNDGCFSVDVNVDFWDMSSGIISDISDITVSPNPFKDNIQIAMPKTMSGDADIKLYDIYGRLILQSYIKDEKGINLQRYSLSSGVYVLQIWRGQTLLETIRLVKE